MIISVLLYELGQSARNFQGGLEFLFLAPGGGGRILSPLCRLEAHFTDCRRPEDEADQLIQFSTKAENAYRQNCKT